MTGKPVTGKPVTGPHDSPVKPAAVASVGIVGGGLAGLAAAAALADHGLRVEIFEARRRLGGRATSFEDRETGELLDHCQHVAMGCCTNFADFCQRTRIAHLFRCDRQLHFFGPSRAHVRLAACRWLPAPLHLAPSLLRLSYLSFRERVGVARALFKLARLRPSAETARLTIGEWLASQNQSQRAIRRFWEVVLVSALAESLDRASLCAARKVFVDGFLRSRGAYRLRVPTEPLHQLYDGIADWLRDRGAIVHLESRVRGASRDERQGCMIHLDTGSQATFDFAIIALPWRRVAEVLPAELAEIHEGASQVESAPISSLHLWFDRPLTSLPHAVLVDRLSQWVFARPAGRVNDRDEFYYQVVISGSREVAARDRAEVLHEVLSELQAIFTTNPRLLRWRMVTEPQAVFSARVGFDAHRPAQKTALPNVMLAGDWTQTGWPATMESAIRSGYLAAELVLQQLGTPASILAPDLPAGWLARRLGME